MTGGLPFMTKGPWAMFFGGHDILPELSDRKAGRHIQILGLASVIFNISILCRKQGQKNLPQIHRHIYNVISSSIVCPLGILKNLLEPSRTF